MRLRTLAALFAAGLVAVGVAVAGVNGNWSEHPTGAEEVPVRDTQAQGQATFHLSKDGLSLDYRLTVANIDNAFMAHIHTAAPGVNGPIVVWLAPSTAPTPGPVGGGAVNGVFGEGTITAANLVGPLAGQPLSALVELMRTNMAYVNVHTNDGVDPINTGPGDFPGGEIRADIDP
jgi:hypothetical protein